MLQGIRSLKFIFENEIDKMDEIGFRLRHMRRSDNRHCLDY